MYSSHLKKMHEIKNKFRYDMCFKMQNDLYFDDHQLSLLVDDKNNNLKLPTHNTIYTCYTQQDNQQFPFRKFSDIFWYADSVTFDRFCNFYKWLPTIGAKSFIQNEDRPKSIEYSLYYYSKMMNMQIQPITVNPKIYSVSADRELYYHATV